MSSTNTEAGRLRAQLASMNDSFKAALPSHIHPDRFQRVVLTVVQTTPDLLAADRQSLLTSCLKCAADGLVPDGREAALVIFNTKDKAGKWHKLAQYVPMFTGIQKRVRNSGQIASVEARVICEFDEFVWRQGVDSTVVHTPKFPGPRGKPIGAYAIAKFKDGSDPQIEVMDVDEIEKTRKVSKSAQKEHAPWTEWWEEMARKTVFKRLAKWLPLDAEVDALLRHPDAPALEAPTVESTAETVAAIAANGTDSAKLDALEYEAPVEYDMQTGEIAQPALVLEREPGEEG